MEIKLFWKLFHFFKCSKGDNLESINHFIYLPLNQTGGTPTDIVKTKKPVLLSSEIHKIFLFKTIISKMGFWNPLLLLFSELMGASFLTFFYLMQCGSSTQHLHFYFLFKLLMLLLVDVIQSPQVMYFLLIGTVILVYEV